MSKFCACAALVFLAAGCGQKQPPTSGGRTAAFWAEALKQDDVAQRRKAALKLGPLALTDAAALPALLQALADKDPEVRANAARALGIYTGPKAEQVLPALRHVHDADRDAKVRETAKKAIEKLSGT